MTWLREQLPHVAMFLETFEKPKRSICSPKSAGTSVATSGVSSMQPRKRRVRTKRTLLA